MNEVKIHTVPSVNRGDVSNVLRVDHTSALVTTQSGSGRYGEAALKGRVYAGEATGLTLLTASGNTVGHSAAQAVTATGTSLFNPATSNVALVMLRVSISADSGTFAAGGVHHGVGSGQSVLNTISGAKAGTSMLVGGGAAASQGRIFEKATSTTYTGASAVTALAPLAGSTATAAANAYLHQIVDEIDGAIVLLPGAEYRPLFTAVGTSVVYNIGYVWMEVPVAAI